MSELKARLRSDLTEAMKARESVRTSTLRMTLTAVTNAEVAGDRPRELSDDEVLAVVAKETKKRREAAEAYDAASRPELAERERAEATILQTYLPQQLTDDELAGIVTEAVVETGASSMRDMGKVMKVVQPKVAGRAEGARVAAEVRRRLS